MSVTWCSRSSNLLHKAVISVRRGFLSVLISVTHHHGLISDRIVQDGFTSKTSISELHFSDHIALPPTTFPSLLDQPFPLTLKSKPSVLPKALTLVHRSLYLTHGTFVRMKKAALSVSGLLAHCLVSGQCSYTNDKGQPWHQVLITLRATGQGPRADLYVTH